MFITELFSKKQTVISFEIFPPKKNTPINSIYKTIDSLATLSPDYISVTYGAGGSTKDTTLEISSLIKKEYKIEPLSHLTCLTSTKKEINSFLEQLSNSDIQNILALRGDIPKNSDIDFPNPLHYEYASDLINHISKTKKFCIGGACYPEGHLESKSLEADLFNLKQKCSLGVDFLISQLFFDNNLFLNFHNKLKNFKIKTPIQLGIMPIINKRQISHIISLCGSSIPKNLQNIINKYENNPQALKDAGIAYATQQIIELLSLNQISGIHIYTMNKPEIATRIYKNVSSIIEANNIKDSSI